MKLSWTSLVTCDILLFSALGLCIDSHPTIDLGYEVHEGSLNATGDYYVFSNIPYAKQPVGNLRFKEALGVEKKSNGGGVNTGHTGVGNDGKLLMCPQAYPEWALELTAELNGTSLKKITSLLNDQPGQTEECLVLDVYVPTGIFEHAKDGKAPVLMWIHGGGFTYGSKTHFGSPSGLIARSKLEKDDGVIMISINYRLGMFGWLTDDPTKKNPDPPPNLGLHDQRLALDWVQKYIGLFGGNPTKVTVMGESAGAASIVHHLTAYGGAKPSPFKQAIPQSPGFQFNINFEHGYSRTFEEASRYRGRSIEGIPALRNNFTSEELMTVNKAIVLSAPYGTFVFGPGPDNSYVPDLPQVLLYNGHINKDVDILTSHTANEAFAFTPANIRTDEDVYTYVKDYLPFASEDTIKTLLTDPNLYPNAASKDGVEYPWKTQFERASRIAADIGFSCTSRYLATAKDNDTYNYVFAYPPAWHAGDVPYVFFNGDESSLDYGFPVDKHLAQGLQDYILSFVKSGDPNTKQPASMPEFPLYGEEAAVLEVGIDGFVKKIDDLKNERCDWIQQAMVKGPLHPKDWVSETRKRRRGM
ncbi:hypothetical protein AAE478_010205 [Parahypoxylon ruwenzoriense]